MLTHLTTRVLEISLMALLKESKMAKDFVAYGMRIACWEEMTIKVTVHIKVMSATTIYSYWLQNHLMNSVREKTAMMQKALLMKMIMVLNCLISFY